MVQLTDVQVVTALSGAEHGCAFDEGFTLAVGRAARHRHLRDHGYANRSGLSFGGVQLDAGSSAEGQSAFREMLAYGLSKGALTPKEAAHYSLYAGKRRPDLDPKLGPHVERDIRDLNAKLYFNPATHDGVKAISERHQAAYVGRVVTPKINGFLRDHADHPLFDGKRPEFYPATTEMLSRLNRSGEARFDSAVRMIAAAGPRLGLAGLGSILGKTVDPRLAAVGGSDLRDYDRAGEVGLEGPIPRSACRPRARSWESVGR